MDSHVLEEQEFLAHVKGLKTIGNGIDVAAAFLNLLRIHDISEPARTGPTTVMAQN